MQSVLVANLALESARRGFGVLVADCGGADGHQVRSLVGSVSEDVSDDRFGRTGVRVSLYGLPPVVIRETAPDTSPSSRDGDEGPGGGDAPGKGRHIILVSAPGGIDCLAGTAGVGRMVVVSGGNEKDLLRCYAALRLAAGTGCLRGACLVFDSVENPARAEELYARFGRHVEDRLPCVMAYGGILVRDKMLERSIVESRPLVLFSASSPSRDAILHVCSRILGDVHPCAREGA